MLQRGCRVPVARAPRRATWRYLAPPCSAAVQGIHTSSSGISTTFSWGKPADPYNPLPLEQQKTQQHLQQRLFGRPTADSVGPAPAPGAQPRDSARWLTRRLGACDSWQELQGVWHDYYPQTNAVHITAAATTLTRLARGAPRKLQQQPHDQQQHYMQSSSILSALAASDLPELAKFATSLLSCAVDRLPELDARGVANLLHAHATLQRVAPHSTRAAAGALSALALAAAALAPGMRPQEVSNTLWALASLGLGPRLPLRWFEEFEAGSMGAAAHMSPQEAAGAVWACAQLKWRPGGPWLQQVLVGGVDLSLAGPREVCTLLWGYSTLPKARNSTGSDWEDAWQLACCKRILQILPVAGPADVTQAWVAFSRLQRPPPRPLLGPLLDRTTELLPSLRPQALAAVLHSLACLGLDPGSEWWGTVGHHLQGSSVLRASTPQGLSMISWALGRLRPQLVHAQLGIAALVDSSCNALAAHARMHAAAAHEQQQQQQQGEFSLSCGAFTAPGLAALAWGLGRMGAEVPHRWFEAFEAACANAWEDLTAGELAMVLVGLGGMRIMSEEQSAPLPVASNVSSSSSSSSSGCVWSEAWAQQALDASRRALPGAPLQEITALAVGAARLGLSPDASWSTAFEEALASQLEQRRPSSLSQATQQLQQQRRQQRQQDCLWVELGDCDRTLSPRDASLLLWALARLRLRPSSRLARDLLLATADVAGSMSSRDAAMSLWALARLWGSTDLHHSPSVGTGAAARQWQRPPESVSMLIDEILAGQQRRLAVLTAGRRRWSTAPAPAGTQQVTTDTALDDSAALSEARDVALSLRALARLSHKPDPAWLDTAWTVALAPALPALATQSPQALTAALDALCMLRSAPSPTTGWLSDIAIAAGPLLPHWPPALVTRALLSFAYLRGAWVGSDWLTSACGALDARALSTLSVAELAGAVLGLTRLGHAPGAEWAAAALRELMLRRDAGECGGDEGCEVRQDAALQSAAAMAAMD